MRKTLNILFTFFLLMSVLCVQTQAWFFDGFISDWSPNIRYCQGDDCGLQEGIDLVKDGITDLETDRSASEYIQDIVAYLLTFISLLAVIYIIYSGFQIMVWNGDEEKLKKSKQTIIYVVIWIVVIWLSWPITLFILNFLN